MYLGTYTFRGDPDALVPAYDRLRATFPPSALELHVCVIGEDAITVLDACPDRATHEAFSRGPELAAALAGAGLPTPDIRGLGDVHVAHLREAVG
jgi:hypothetical protein